MPKFYVSSGTLHRIVQSDNFPSAAATAVFAWKTAKQKIGKSIRVSEVGFDSDNDHPAHLEDAVFTTNYVKALLR